MTRLGGHAFHAYQVAFAGAALLLGGPNAAAQSAPFEIIDHFEPLPAGPERGDVLSTLRPVVWRFDFEDGQTGPNALPPNFYRFVAPSQGFPPFGEMRIVRGEGYVANGGDRTDSNALQFDLEGGSMSARIGTSVIPVLPFADYVVACRVRTQGLQHASAHLAAWLCDSAGRVIDGSRVESRAADAGERWDTLSLEVHGDFSEAADLIFELQLTQPRFRAADNRIDLEPRMQDVRGRAWFDDVTISHLPRVVLAMSQTGNVIAQGNAASFAVQVNELASKELATRLRVLDIDGVTVHDQTFPAPRGREPSVVSVPISRCGWYRAVLDVSSSEYVARRRWVDFVVLPRDSRPSLTPPFGVRFAHPPGLRGLDDANMASRLRSGVAIVPTWDQQTTLAGLAQTAAARQATIEQLLRSNASVAFAMADVPEELARAAGASSRTALEVLGGDAARWRPYIDDLLMHFGLSISRWVVGSSADLAGQDVAAALMQLDSARQALSAFVPSPTLYMAWPVDLQPVDDARPSAVALHVPVTIAPASVPEFLSPWLASSSRATIVSLDLLPASGYSPRQRMTDALLRGLNAWRAGAPATVITQPWRSSDDRDQSPTPDVVFAAWHTLNVQLAGRRFVSELSLGSDVHVWAVAGKDSDDAAVVAWCDRDASAGPLSLEIQLADRAVQVIDAFGNTSTIEPTQGLHRLELGELPIFVQGVSLELVLFRSGVSIQPAFIPAASKVHEHEIVIRNPWDTMIAGTLRLTGDEELQVMPAVQEFAIASRGEARLPIQIIPQRGILAGPRVLAAEITINADRLHTLKMDLPIEVGLKDIEVNVAWSTMRNPLTGMEDLLISPAVTNRSDRPVNLDVDLLAADVSQMRRTIAALQPGQTQTRTFRIANGAKFLAGKPIRLGVAQRDGVARLNKIIVIGEGETRAVAGADSSP